MPRIKRGLEPSRRPAFPHLLAELVAELRHDRDAGQPMIEEFHFSSGLLRVTVIWDKWYPLSDEDRAQTIRQAYEQAEGKALGERVALAMGLTVPEAHEAGLLPFQITAALRPGDPVTLEECRHAMLDQGGSLLFDTPQPQLRFATAEDAAACVQRLLKALPGSAAVWLMVRDAGVSQR